MCNFFKTEDENIAFLRNDCTRLRDQTVCANPLLHMTHLNISKPCTGTKSFINNKKSNFFQENVSYIMQQRGKVTINYLFVLLQYNYGPG